MTEKERETKRRWKITHKDKMLEYNRNYYQRNKDVMREKRKKYYCTSKGIILKACKRYYEKNKEEVLKRQQAYRADRKPQDPLCQAFNEWREENDLSLAQASKVLAISKTCAWYWASGITPVNLDWIRKAVPMLADELEERAKDANLDHA